MSAISGLGSAAQFLSMLRIAPLEAPRAGGVEAAASGEIASGQRSEFAREHQKLMDYLAERDARFAREHPEGPADGSMGVATRVGPDGYSPFITAEQQQTIDEITARYTGRHDFADLYAELAQRGVHPDQISASAKWFIGPNGNVRDRNGNPVFHQWLDQRF